MKWTGRWIARAQRRADARDQRYRRRQSGEIPPGLLEGLASRRQAAIDRRQAGRQARLEALLHRYPEVASYDEACRLLRLGSVRGPDRAEVCVCCVRSGQIWVGGPALPGRWRYSRAKWLAAVAGHLASLPLKRVPLQQTYSTYAYTVSGPPADVVRRFLFYEESVLYAALVAKRVQAGGVEALRQEAAEALRQDGEGWDRLTW